ncbi:MAG: LacI family DNA-binding transcriptional regulator [Anaerolineae bacterium]
MAITIRDVAKQAGVSIKTVSRVINNETVVSEDTRSRVVTVMQELGYTPNISAQRLARGRSYVLGLVFHNATWNYIDDVLRGMMETSRAEGYGSLIHPCDIDRPEDQAEIMRLVTQQRVDGFIFTPPCDNASILLQKLQTLQIPFVRLTPRDRRLPLPFVAANDWQGAYDMTEYLLSLGHRRIGFIRGNPTHQASHDRLAGYKAALEAHQVSFDPMLVKPGDFHFNSGVSSGRELFEIRPRPTAIFASNDNMAAGVLAAAHQLGVAVPAELSVAGFDDVRLAQQVWPSLTTVRQPIHDIAKWATCFLIGLLKNEALDNLHYELPTTLVIRESTGQPPPLS